MRVYRAPLYNLSVPAVRMFTLAETEPKTETETETYNFLPYPDEDRVVFEEVRKCGALNASMTLTKIDARTKWTELRANGCTRRPW